MQYRSFGDTGWSTSVISLGTVEMGVPYGLYLPGEVPIPDRETSIGLLLSAFEAGVNLIDTAPAYGDSEILVGRAIAEWREPLLVAGKIPTSGSDQESILERSLRNLGRETIDLLQLHNCETKHLTQGSALDVALRARSEGKARALGATVYAVSDALAILDHPEFASIQVAYNLLDQRMADEVFPKAQEKGVAVLVRSAFLKGVLTIRSSALPPRLPELTAAARRAEVWAQSNGIGLSEAALRFCLSRSEPSSVLVGVRNRRELDEALSACGNGPLPPNSIRSAADLGMRDTRIVDPRTWGLS